MIRVKIELISARGHEHDRLLGIAEIANVGEARHASNQRGRYYRYAAWLSKWAPKEREVWKRGDGILTDAEIQERLEGEVDQFDRDARGAWDLLYLVLRNIVGGRNP